MSFEAYYDGVCVDCEGPFKAGVLIERASTSSRRGTYRHVLCPKPEPTVLDLGPRERICSDCHLVHPPGEC